MAAPQLAMRNTPYGIYRVTPHAFEKAIERVTEELKTEGFGVLTTIDVKKTLKEKIDVEFPRYTILGACNPKLAHQGLTAEPDLGLLLPCNVVVHEAADGKAHVSAIDPTELFDKLVQAASVRDLAQDVKERLTRALDRAAGQA